MKLVFLDIETLPMKEENLYFLEEKLRIKHGELSTSELMEKLEEEFRKTALSGVHGRILCIGLMVEEVDISFSDYEVRNHKLILKPSVFGQDRNTLQFHLDEKQTLRGFWKYLKENIEFDQQKDLLVGHNLIGFDLPFIYQRSLIHGVRPTYRLLEGKPWEVRWLFDTMEEWRFKKTQLHVSLNDLAFAFGLDCPKDVERNGAKIYELFSAGKHEEVRNYCLADVLCTRQLFYRMNYLTAPPLELEQSTDLEVEETTEANANSEDSDYE